MSWLCVALRILKPLAVIIMGANCMSQGGQTHTCPSQQLRPLCLGAAAELPGVCVVVWDTGICGQGVPFSPGPWSVPAHSAFWIRPGETQGPRTGEWQAQRGISGHRSQQHISALCSKEGGRRHAQAQVPIQAGIMVQVGRFAQDFSSAGWQERSFQPATSSPGSIASLSTVTHMLRSGFTLGVNT